MDAGARQALRGDGASEDAEDEAAAIFGRAELRWAGYLLVVFLGLPLLLMRLLLWLLLGSVLVPLMLVALKCGTRSCVTALFKFNSRTILLLLGVWRVSTSGKKADVPEDGCIIVANHVGVAEIMWLMYEYGTAFVAKADYRHIPVAGEAAEHLDFIFVDQRSSVGASGAISEYFAAGGPRGRRLCIFPEGTSTNGNGIAKFRTGAFLPPVTILPVAISHPFCEGYQFDPHYSIGKLHYHLLRMMCNPWNCMHVEYLPPVAHDARLGVRERAEATRVALAEALGVPLVDASYEDKVAYEVQLGLRRP